MAAIPYGFVDELEKILEQYSNNEAQLIPNEFLEILSSFSDETSSDQLDMGFMFVLKKDKHIFRHAKEVQTGSRGGYLEGKINLPG